MAWLIILGALWTYPIVAYLTFRLTEKNLKFRKYISIIIFIACILTVGGIATNISTTISELDWLFITSLYFFTCLTLWATQFQSGKILKSAGIILMFTVYGAGYFSGSIGVLGVAFVTAEFETDKERWFDNGLIYKEQTLGNAISDHRGKRIEIYRTIKWFPILEWKVRDKTYNSIITYANPLTVNYRPSENRIYLSTSMIWGPHKKIYKWADTLQLGSR